MKISKALGILEAIKEKETGIVREMAQRYIDDLSRYDNNIKIGTVVEIFIKEFK